MAANVSNDDLQKMSKVEALWSAGVRCTINDIEDIIVQTYNYEKARKRTIVLIGESGTAKSWTWERAAKRMNIGFEKLVGSGLAAEDVRGMPALVKRMIGEKNYPRDMEGVMSLAEDYFRCEPVYKFQLLEVLTRVFTPGNKCILLLDEWAQALKEVQDVFFQIIYDRRIDDCILPEGVMVGSAMNPPSVSEYMLNQISKAAEDRFVMFIAEPTSSEWIEWAESDKEALVNPALVDFVREHPSVYDRNKGRRLHAFSDMLGIVGALDAKDEKKMRTVKHLAHATIDIESGDLFTKYVKAIYEISGVQIVKGDKKTTDRLKKMIGSDVKAVHIHRVHREILKALEDPEAVLKEWWNKKKVDESWMRVSKNIMKYMKHLTARDMDSAISLLKSIIKIGNGKLGDCMNKVFTLPENEEFSKEVMRCMNFPVENKEESTETSKLALSDTI
jgi:MoxR-like ATPase